MNTRWYFSGQKGDEYIADINAEKQREQELTDKQEHGEKICKLTGQIREHCFGL